MGAFAGLMFLCGVISLVLAPFTGITIGTAAAFFLIWFVVRLFA